MSGPLLFAAVSVSSPPSISFRIRSRRRQCTITRPFTPVGPDDIISPDHLRQWFLSEQQRLPEAERIGHLPELCVWQLCGKYGECDTIKWIDEEKCWTTPFKATGCTDPRRTSANDSAECYYMLVPTVWLHRTDSSTRVAMESV